MLKATEPIRLVPKEDGIMSEMAITSNTTPTDKYSNGPLTAYEMSKLPMSTPDKSPCQTYCSCKDGSSHNDTDCSSDNVEKEESGNEPTSSSWYLRYASMMSLYKVCRTTLKAPLSAISIWEKNVKEEEEEEEKEEEKEDEDE